MRDPQHFGPIGGEGGIRFRPWAPCLRSAQRATARHEIPAAKNAALRRFFHAASNPYRIKRTKPKDTRPGALWFLAEKEGFELA